MLYKTASHRIYAFYTFVYIITIVTQEDNSRIKIAFGRKIDTHAGGNEGTMGDFSLGIGTKPRIITPFAIKFDTMMLGGRTGLDTNLLLSCEISVRPLTLFLTRLCHEGCRQKI